MTKKTLEKIKARLTYPAQNWDKFVELVNSKKQISFYSWECPPRQKVKDKYGTWINFDVDIEGVVNGKKLDQYTEFPRLTSQTQNELWFIKEILPQLPRSSYCKIIADTNAPYINPKSLKILGKKKIETLSKRFKKALEKSVQELIGADGPKIILFTNLKKNFEQDYDLFFNLIYENFTKEGSSLLPQSIYRHWINRVTKHVGLTEKEKKEKYEAVKRSIATYAAEGMIFQLLNISKELPNPVWINWEEPPENGNTTEILRSRYGIEQIPILYFVQEDH